MRLYTLILCLLFSFNANASILSNSSCFSGSYQDLNTFTQYIQAQTLKRGEGLLTQEVIQEIKQDYEEWVRLDRDEVSCHFFTYEVDNIPVQGFVLQPKKIPLEELLPVIFNRGGNADLVMPSKYIFKKLLPFAQKGFLVIGSFYRGARVNGIDNEYRLRDEFGGRDVQDVLGLLPIIDTYKGMKNKKVAMWGMSRGGMMAFLAAKQSTRFSAIIADSAPLDIVEEAATTNRMEKVFRTWIPNYAKQKDQVLKERSVAYWFDQLHNIPILLLQGTLDIRVSPMITLKFAQQLQITQHPYELIMYEGTGHGLRGREKDVEDHIARWVRKFAKTESSK